MSRNTGTFNFAANFEVLAKAPLDAKQLVGTKADLTGSTTWEGSGQNWLYDGAIVSVGSDPIPENNGIYFLSAATNYTDINSWVKAGTGEGGGTITGGTNGLSTSGANVVLGGGDGLTGDTTINLNNHALQISTSGLTPSLIGIDETGLLFSFSGGSVTFDDGGGLKYGSTGYSSGYTLTSIPDVHFVTGLTDTYLRLDQSTRQTVSGGTPVFGEGLILCTGITSPLTTGHTRGFLYYDCDYQTVSAQIGTETTLQIGQESIRLVYNSTGSIIPNGALVYTNGVHSGSGVDTVTIALAIATGITESSVIGMATQEIPTGGTGFITTQGNVNGINTLTSPQYSGMSVGDIIYLSPTIEGGVTNIQPTSPNIDIIIGRLLTKDATDGKIFVNISRAFSLNDLTNVSAPSPSLDNVLKFNGLEWVNGEIGATSAGSGVNLYYGTPISNSVTQPGGITADGTAGNGIQVASLLTSPVTSGGTLTVEGTAPVAPFTPRAFVAWRRDALINRTTIDAGVWEFYSYVGVTTIDTARLIHGMYQIVDITGSTITTTGSGTLRTATLDSASGEFSGLYFAGSSTNTDASYLQTPSGIFQISAVTDANNVTIITPQVSGYTNESGVSGSTWNKLFTATGETLTSIAPVLSETTSSQPAFSVLETDKLGEITYMHSSAANTVYLNYNGTGSASFVVTPLITLHNDLAGLQGGTGTERYHISEAEAIVVSNTSNTNTGDETKSTIESKLTGTISSHTHDYSNILNTPDLSVYQTVSGFNAYTGSTETRLQGIENDITYISGVTDTKLNINTFTGYTASTESIFNGYTGTTQPIIDAAITGATNGLTKTGRQVKLGGTLSEATTISGNSLNLCFGDIGSSLNMFAVNSTEVNFETTDLLFNVTNNAEIIAGDFTIALSGSCGTITDSNSVGLKYAGDYSANYSCLSIPNAGWVTGQTGGISAENGLSRQGNNIVLGGTLTGDTTIDADSNNFCIHTANVLTLIGNNTCFSGTNTNINFSSSGYITDESGLFGGIKYGGDYENEFTARSLASVQYVTGQTAALSSDIAYISGVTDTNIADISYISGVTATNIANISYISGVTDTNIADIAFISGVTDTNIADISYISGVTATNIADIAYISGVTDSKLAISTFNSYTGNTQPIINTALTGATNGLSYSNRCVCLGGALLANTNITGAHTLNVCGGARLSSQYGYQISGVTIFDVSRISLTNINIGCAAGNSTGTGINNTAIGHGALLSNTIGSNNFANGCYALYFNTSGCNNIAIGCRSLYYNTTGCDNIGYGYQVLHGNISGCNNIALGYQTLISNTTGKNNIAIGCHALYNTSIGSGNVAIGCGAGYNETGSNKLYIANTTTTNPLIYGDFDASGLTINGKLTLGVTPSVGSLTDVVLVRNSGGEVRTVTISSITGATTITANNGITKSATNNIYLGGALTGNTTITSGTHQFNVCGNNSNIRLSSTSVNISGDTVELRYDGLNKITLNGSGTGIDGPMVFAQCKASYLSNFAPFTARELPDAAWVTGQTAALSADISYISGVTDTNIANISYISGVTDTNIANISYLSGATDANSADISYISGVTDTNSADIAYLSGVSNTVNICIVGGSYTATTTNDFIGVSGGTNVCITLPATPKLGQRISISDVCGIALGDNIKILCNGNRCINGATCATINTEYGSMTFINNGISWSAVAFMN